MRSTLLDVWSHPRPVRAVAARLMRQFPFLSYKDRLAICAVDRPHYGHCIFEAAKLAARLGYPKISALEFGCGGGNGLLNAEMHIAQIERIFPVKVELYGFDTGAGLPPGKDYRDFPHYFNPGQFSMRQSDLRDKLEIAQLVLGDVRDTCKTFFSNYTPAPIGCVFHDLDFYSSTSDALTLFDADSSNFLPRIFMYFDDIIGNNTWLPNQYAGEALAISEFNARHERKKIVPNLFMSRRYSGESWCNQIYNYHDFDHPQYNVFVAAEEQIMHEDEIQLR